jgi:hypothetical protein
MEEESATDLIISALDDPVDGLTPEKFIARGRLGLTSNETIQFFVRRHRSALGSQYTKGIKMPACVEYNQEYFLSVKDGAIRLGGIDSEKLIFENVHSIARTIYEADPVFDLEANGDAWIVSFSLSKGVREVNSETELVKLVQAELSSWDLSAVYGDEISELLPEKDQLLLFKKIEGSLQQIAEEEAQRAWAEK